MAFSLGLTATSELGYGWSVRAVSIAFYDGLYGNMTRI